jgi:hypothetical protein
MDPREYVVAKQRLWAKRRAIRLGSQFRNSPNVDERQRGEELFVHDLDDNLFEPLTDAAHAAFEDADGGELSANKPGEGNMYALHSSSAAACNLFHYWSRRGEITPIARACGLPSGSATTLEFEAKFPISAEFDRSPNIDAVISYGSGQLMASAIECKLCEPYSGWKHSGLSPRYLDLAEQWRELPSLRVLAETIAPDDARFEHLHAAQLVKHVLGLVQAFGKRGFRLLYLWYDVPGIEPQKHRAEVEEFRATAAADGITFQEATYQEVIVALARRERAQHPGPVDYIAERYL